MTTGLRPHIIRTPSSWIEGEAEAQLERVARHPEIDVAIGLPDLHPGKGSPIGAVFFSRSHLFPYLVGNDIGCGMGLWQLDAKTKSIKLDRWERRLRNGQLEGMWAGEQQAWLAERGVAPSGHERSLGTLGGGNHFAEILKVSEVVADDVLSSLGVDRAKAVMLIHSGSRGYGEEILRSHVDRFTDAGFEAGSQEAVEYLQRHDHAVAWASANRALVAQRMSEALGVAAQPLLDVVHNSVGAAELGGSAGWLHRKGAAPSAGPVVPIPGSRGAFTYLVAPTGDGEINGHSLAHGAGRKWKRSEAKGRLKKKYSSRDLERTALGSRVLCDDRALLYEEAPQAYKSIEDVVEALVSAGVARVVAVLTPVMTFKTARR